MATGGAGPKKIQKSGECMKKSKKQKVYIVRGKFCRPLRGCRAGLSTKIRINAITICLKIKKLKCAGETGIARKIGARAGDRIFVTMNRKTTFLPEFSSYLM